MKIILLLIIGISGQAEPMVRPFPQDSLEQCMSNAKRFLGSTELLAQDNVMGLAAACRIDKVPEQKS